MQGSEETNIKVFISYAHEDANSADRLYNDLKNAGLEPWLDKESLLAGDDWKEVIEKEISNSRYFIPLLSSNSIGKKGYVTKEWSKALDVFASFKEYKRFIIPVRLDDCKVSNRKIKNLHIVDLFPNRKTGVQKIIKAILPEKKPDIMQLDDLLSSIKKKECIPIIGPEISLINTAFLEKIADSWSKKYEYPLDNPKDISQIAQFLVIEKDDPIIPKRLLSDTIKEIETKSPNYSTREYYYHPYSVLADLHQPIYITTNFDTLMEKALRDKGKNPITEFYKWDDKLRDYANRAGLDSIFDNNNEPEITPAKPLVYHLCGYAKEPRSMVLTERDYFDYIIHLNKDGIKGNIPTLIKRSLARSSLLIVGYQLHNFYIRDILQSITNDLDDHYLYNLMVLSFASGPNPNNSQQLYLDKYIKHMFSLRSVWSDPYSFSKTLREMMDKSDN